MNSKTPTINTSSSSRIGPQFLFGHVSNILLHVKRNSRRVSYIMKGSQVSKMPWVDLGYWLVLTNFVQQWQFCNYEVSWEFAVSHWKYDDDWISLGLAIFNTTYWLKFPIRKGRIRPFHNMKWLQNPILSVTIFE